MNFLKTGIVLASLTLASPAYPEPTSEEPKKQDLDDLVAIQKFIFLTSTHAFNGHSHHLREALMNMGPLLETVSALAAGELGDSEITISEGVKITVREYVKRIVSFACMPDVAGTPPTPGATS